MTEPKTPSVLQTLEKVRELIDMLPKCTGNMHKDRDYWTGVLTIFPEIATSYEELVSQLKGAKEALENITNSSKTPYITDSTALGMGLEAAYALSQITAV